MVAETDRRRDESMFLNEVHRVVYLRRGEFTEKTGMDRYIDAFVACRSDEVKNLGTCKLA
jgi:hypothetical protein